MSFFNPLKIIGKAGQLAESGEKVAEAAAHFGEENVMNVINTAKTAIEDGANMTEAATNALVDFLPDEAALIPEAVDSAVAAVGDLGIEFVIPFALVALL